MKAIVWTNYGGPEVLQLKELDKPSPKDNEVLIRIVAASVTAGDTELRQMKIPVLFRLPIRLYVGIRKPIRRTVLGMEMAGKVEMVGKNVTRFIKGDSVFGTSGMVFGAYAEYVCLPENSDMGVLAKKPEKISFEEAAVVPVAGLEVLHFLEQGKILNGQHLLINGAGGSIGTFAVQLAKHYGAKVTAVDSAGKLEMLRSIGADHVIDYAQEDFTQNGERYDAILDVVGKLSLSRSEGSLSQMGRFLLANPSPSQMLYGLWLSIKSSKKVITGGSRQKPEDLLLLAALMEAGNLKAIIDRSFPLEELAQAHRYVETGQKLGNVSINVGSKQHRKRENRSGQ